ncbi:hypothetical protein F0U59_09410 [Archangium gephyra]|nr:hypothetical protein F0U59_09410 [Archangium gephyra]
MGCSKAKASPADASPKRREASSSREAWPETQSSSGRSGSTWTGSGARWGERKASAPSSSSGVSSHSGSDSSSSSHSGGMSSRGGRRQVRTRAGLPVWNQSH